MLIIKLEIISGLINLSSLMVGNNLLIIGVLVLVGEIALTIIFFSLSSWAQLRVKLFNAAFVQQ